MGVLNTAEPAAWGRDVEKGLEGASGMLTLLPQANEVRTAAMMAEDCEGRSEPGIDGSCSALARRPRVRPAVGSRPLHSREMHYRHIYGLLRPVHALRRGGRSECPPAAMLRGVAQ